MSTPEEKASENITKLKAGEKRVNHGQQSHHSMIRASLEPWGMPHKVNVVKQGFASQWSYISQLNI